MADLKFMRFNNLIINIIHIRWCENVHRDCGKTSLFGIKIVVNTGNGCESFYKWFDSQEDRDIEFKNLSSSLLELSIT